MDDNLEDCLSSTGRKEMKWEKLLAVLKNESEALSKQSYTIETRLRDCRLKMKILRLTSLIDMYGSNALPSRSTRNIRKRKFQEQKLDSPNYDGRSSSHSSKESNVGGLWTPDDSDYYSKLAPKYVPPVTSKDVDQLHAFNFRGDDSTKKILQLKITARIVPLTMTNLKRNVDVEAVNKALKGYTHNWSLKFTPLDDDTLKFIDKIVVYLHPTCEEQFVVLKLTKRKRTADVNQYGWGSFKVRLMYHFIHSEFNRPVEQLLDLDFIVNQISGFERLAEISVCDIANDTMNRLRSFHTDEKHTIISSESEEDKSPNKKRRLFEDEGSMEENNIPFDDIFSQNSIDPDPYSGALFSSESLPNLSVSYPGRSPLTDELVRQLADELSHYSSTSCSTAMENNSQSTLTQSDSTPNTTTSGDSKRSKLKDSNSSPLSSQTSSVDSLNTSGYGSQSPDSLELDSTRLISSRQGSPFSSQSVSTTSEIIPSHASQTVSTTSEIAERSKCLNKLHHTKPECSNLWNKPHHLNPEKLTVTSGSELLKASHSSSQSSIESECIAELKNLPSLSEKESEFEPKPLPEVSKLYRSNQELVHLPSAKPKTSTPCPKPIIVQALTVNSNGKILIKHDGKNKLIRIIKAGSTSLLKNPQNFSLISKPTPNPIPVTSRKQDADKSTDENLKGILSRKFEKVRQTVSGMEFEEALIYCLKNYPIVTEEATSLIYKQLHPYAAKSNEEFLSWKFGKRAASLTKLARFTHGILSDNCKSEPWSWVQVRQYIKYHGYAPVAKINGVYIPCSYQLKLPETSLTCKKPQADLAELRNLQCKMDEASCEVDVDDSMQPKSNVSQFSGLHTKSKDQIMNSFTTPEDDELRQWLMRTNDIFDEFVIDDFVPEVLMSIFKSFAEFMLRRSLAAMMNRKRRHNIIREKDVLTAVLLSDKLRILTEQDLGKKSIKYNIQSY
ncbi:uncharacterized protein LOC111045178 [Nilaparvata lugens]|uniref:uncharacterized protein LOC111045178 n=1 Tax=Nilaparvata lugens TaxID=108931 RepID=UPI000B9996E4|nr:uncharacterized protein LOC111045178 [Nilaparvata lugens]XP_022186196.1 uncharacterized protein LOC111045178 [Nilaparvata lugens]XP_022186197.1 uncharacterized protein LOC111045178 [Nilaparvata lugens]XP_022186198.1 uncharacterized protein LOC111045178 [Nilaparvata lugens]